MLDVGVGSHNISYYLSSYTVHCLVVPVKVKSAVSLGREGSLHARK